MWPCFIYISFYSGFSFYLLKLRAKTEDSLNTKHVKKNSTQEGTTDRQTHGQPDLLTESAQRANSVKIMLGPNHPSPDCQ